MIAVYADRAAAMRRAKALSGRRSTEYHVTTHETDTGVHYKDAQIVARYQFGKQL
jgi:hypothetical protein